MNPEQYTFLSSMIKEDIQSETAHACALCTGFDSRKRHRALFRKEPAIVREIGNNPF
jgi:hypothetical protein